MNNSEILILNGSPGAGKTTIANSIADILRSSDIPHAVIDVDELARIFPEDNMFTMQWQNLAAVWPNYGIVDGLRVIIPVLIDTQEDLLALKAATPCKRFTICELIAPVETRKQRVTEREPNEFWQTKLRKLVDNYESRDENQKFADFKISTDNKSITKTADEIIHTLGWNT